jgi:hypothetical protein
LQEGTLSFLGRAQYLNGDYARARSTLEKRLLSTRTTILHACTLALPCLAKARHRTVCETSTRAWKEFMTFSIT